MTNVLVLLTLQAPETQGLFFLFLMDARVSAMLFIIVSNMVFGESIGYPIAVLL